MTEAFSDFHEVRHFRVSINVRQPAIDWLDRLRAHGEQRCSQCLKPLADSEGIYVNTEGKDGDAPNGELLCSWPCLLLIAASVCVGENQLPPAIVVTERESGES